MLSTSLFLVSSLEDLVSSEYPSFMLYILWVIFISWDLEYPDFNFDRQEVA